MNRKYKIIIVGFLTLIVFSLKMSIDIPKLKTSYNKWQESKARVDSLKKLVYK